jgi:hypothetical protein
MKITGSRAAEKTGKNLEKPPTTFWAAFLIQAKTCLDV